MIASLLLIHASLPLQVFISLSLECWIWIGIPRRAILDLVLYLLCRYCDSVVDEGNVFSHGCVTMYMCDGIFQFHSLSFKKKTNHMSSQLLICTFKTISYRVRSTESMIFSIKIDRQWVRWSTSNCQNRHNFISLSALLQSDVVSEREIHYPTLEHRYRILLPTELDRSGTQSTRDAAL